jgi:hypothetical protein
LRRGCDVQLSGNGCLRCEFKFLQHLSCGAPGSWSRKHQIGLLKWHYGATSESRRLIFLTNGGSHSSARSPLDRSNWYLRPHRWSSNWQDGSPIPISTLQNITTAEEKAKLDQGLRSESCHATAERLYQLHAAVGKWLASNNFEVKRSGKIHAPFTYTGKRAARSRTWIDVIAKESDQLMSKFQAQTVSLIESLAFRINITDDIDVSVIVRLQCICLQLEERGRTVMHRSIRLPVKSYLFAASCFR